MTTQEDPNPPTNRRVKVGAGAVGVAVLSAGSFAALAPPASAGLYEVQYDSSVQITQCSPYDPGACWPAWISYSASAGVDAVQLNGPGSAWQLTKDHFSWLIRDVGTDGNHPGCLSFDVMQNMHYRDYDVYNSAHYLDREIGAIYPSTDSANTYESNAYKENIYRPNVTNWHRMKFQNSSSCSGSMPIRQFQVFQSA